MDVMANRAVLASVKKEKQVKIKKKIEKVSKPVACAKSPPRVTKKKKTQTKAGILKPKKEILKETLKSVENGDSSKLFKKITKPLKKVVKSKDSKESQQNVKQKKNKENKEISHKIKKGETKEVEEITQKVNKQKIKTTEKIPQKLAKQKKFKQPKNKTLVEKKDSSDFTPESLSLKDIKTGVATVLKLAKDQTKSDKSLMDEENSPIFLQLCCVKIPKTPTRHLRMSLPHSLVSPDDDVALIVMDLKRGRRRDYEPTVDHFEQLLKEHKCDRIKTVIPINQIKTEYDQFELKRNLVFSYDHFLIDGRIAGHVARLLGKIFSKKRKLPTSIRMGSKDLKHEIDYALSKTSMQLNSNGDTHIVQIGTTAMKKNEIVENIQAACTNLATNYPGGWANIRSLRIKTQSSLAIPIYMTMKNKNKVAVPDIKPKRPKAYLTHEGELTTVEKDATVIVTPEGTVTLKTEMDSKDKDEEVKLDSEMDSTDEEEEEEEDKEV